MQDLNFLNGGWKITHFGLGNDQLLGLLRSAPHKFRGGFKFYLTFSVFD